MARVLLPLPERDFDPTEAAVPWRALRGAGHEVVIATASGGVPACDPLLLTGVVLRALRADADARAAYAAMTQDASFRAPQRIGALQPEQFDGLLLPGGHAPGMRPWLEDVALQDFVARFAALGRPWAAICHGVLVAARARDPASGRSVLHGRRTTCLPKYMEALAYALTAWRRGRYYRTYPAYVEDEVRAALADPSQFVRGPLTLGAKGTAQDDHPAFVCEDGPYVSGRWPGDAHRLARLLLARLD
jgi:putative intracellular protease/amidase